MGTSAATGAAAVPRHCTAAHATDAQSARGTHRVSVAQPQRSSLWRTCQRCMWQFLALQWSADVELSKDRIKVVQHSAVETVEDHGNFKDRIMMQAHKCSRHTSTLCSCLTNALSMSTDVTSSVLMTHAQQIQLAGPCSMQDTDCFDWVAARLSSPPWLAGASLLGTSDDAWQLWSTKTGQ